MSSTSSSSTNWWRLLAGNPHDCCWSRPAFPICSYTYEAITTNLYPIEVFDNFCSVAEPGRAWWMADQYGDYTVPSFSPLSGEVVDVYYPVDGYAFDGSAPTLTLLSGHRNDPGYAGPDYAVPSCRPLSGEIKRGVIGFAPNECLVAVAYLVGDDAGPLFFYPLYDALLLCEYESNVVVVPLDLVGEVTASVTGGLVRRYREGVWTGWATAVSVQAADWLQLKVTASALPGTSATVVLTVGEYVSEFSVTTAACEFPDNYIVFATRIRAALSTWVVSATITVPACVPCGTEVSVSNGEYSVDTGTGFNAWTTVSDTALPGDRIRVRGMSSASYSTETVVTLTIGAFSGTFTIVTIAEGEEPLASAEVDTVSLTIVEGVFPAYVNACTLTCVSTALGASAEQVTVTTVNTAQTAAAEQVTITVILESE